MGAKIRFPKIGIDPTENTGEEGSDKDKSGTQGIIKQKRG
jgi:hypothetical protein